MSRANQENFSQWLDAIVQRCYDNFELWQRSTDQIWEHWVRHPLAVQAMCRTLDHLLELRKLYQRSFESVGLQPFPYQQSVKQITDLFANAVSSAVKKN